MQLLKPIPVINSAITCVLTVSQAPNNVSSARLTYHSDVTSHGQPSAFSPYRISRGRISLFSPSRRLGFLIRFLFFPPCSTFSRLAPRLPQAEGHRLLSRTHLEIGFRHTGRVHVFFRFHCTSLIPASASALSSCWAEFLTVTLPLSLFLSRAFQYAMPDNTSSSNCIVNYLCRR